MERAYSLLQVKSVDQAAAFVTVRGMASTPTPDRMKDIVEPRGARFKIPLPLLLQHDHQQPVGHVTFMRADDSGIPFEAKLPVIKEAGRLKDRVDEAIHSLQHRLFGGVSIGFRADPEHTERLKTGGLRFKSYELMELSLVTIPAQAEATIDSVKAYDSRPRSAPGRIPGRDDRTGRVYRQLQRPAVAGDGGRVGRPARSALRVDEL